MTQPPAQAVISQALAQNGQGCFILSRHQGADLILAPEPRTVHAEDHSTPGCYQTPGIAGPGSGKAHPHTLLPRAPGMPVIPDTILGSKCPSCCQVQMSPCVPQEGLARIKVQGWQGGNGLKSKDSLQPCHPHPTRAAGGSSHPEGCRWLPPPATRAAGTKPGFPFSLPQCPLLLEDNLSDQDSSFLLPQPHPLPSQAPTP